MSSISCSPRNPENLSRRFDAMIRSGNTDGALDLAERISSIQQKLQAFSYIAKSLAERSDHTALSIAHKINDEELRTETIEQVEQILREKEGNFVYFFRTELSQAATSALKLRNSYLKAALPPRTFTCNNLDENLNTLSYQQIEYPEELAHPDNAARFNKVKAIIGGVIDLNSPCSLKQLITCKNLAENLNESLKGDDENYLLKAIFNMSELDVSTAHMLNAVDNSILSIPYKINFIIHLINVCSMYGGNAGNLLNALDNSTISLPDKINLLIHLINTCSISREKKSEILDRYAAAILDLEPNVRDHLFFKISDEFAKLEEVNKALNAIELITRDQAKRESLKNVIGKNPFLVGSYFAGDILNTLNNEGILKVDELVNLIFEINSSPNEESVYQAFNCLIANIDKFPDQKRSEVLRKAVNRLIKVMEGPDVYPLRWSTQSTELKNCIELFTNISDLGLRIWALSYISSHFVKLDHSYSQLNILDETIELALQQEMRFIKTNKNAIFEIITLKHDLNSAIELVEILTNKEKQFELLKRLQKTFKNDKHAQVAIFSKMLQISADRYQLRKDIFDYACRYLVALGEHDLIGSALDNLLKLGLESLFDKGFIDYKSVIGRIVYYKVRRGNIDSASEYVNHYPERFKDFLNLKITRALADNLDPRALYFARNIEDSNYRFSLKGSFNKLFKSKKISFDDYLKINNFLDGSYSYDQTLDEVKEPDRDSDQVLDEVDMTESFTNF